MLNSTDFANFLEIFQYHKIEKENPWVIMLECLYSNNLLGMEQLSQVVVP
jgi:hypothetical protein